MFPRQTLNRRFARHYAQMVAVMFLGMAVLALPAEWALGAAGSSWSELKADSPPLLLLLMAFTMTAPMSAWMYRMGHGWRPNVEMALSMIVPTIAVIGLDVAGVVDDVGALLAIEHVAMLAGMFGVMAARPEEYSGHHDRHLVTA
jgi:hypothetical protein